MCPQRPETPIFARTQEAHYRILIPPEKISHLVLRKDGEEMTATAEEVFGDSATGSGSPGLST